MIRFPEWAKKRDELKLPYIERIWRKAVQKSEIRFMKNAVISENMLNSQPRGEEVIFSIASFPDRIESVYLSVKSLMLQSFKPDRIILWLAKEQFEGVPLPDSLTVLEKYGLSIRFTDDDLKSHKKYFYVMQEYPDSIIVTFDDDIIYGRDVVRRLMEKHVQFPDCVVADSARTIELDEDGVPLEYSRWKSVSPIGVDEPSMRLMALTGSGCLYPPGIMPESTFDRERMKRIAFSADDLWMKYNQLLAGIPVVKAYKNHRIFIMTDYNQSESLSTVNCAGGGNDETVGRMLFESPQIPQILKDSK